MGNEQGTLSLSILMACCIKQAQNNLRCTDLCHVPVCHKLNEPHCTLAAHHANTTKDEPEVKLESSNDNSTAKQTTDPPSTAEAAPKDTPYDNEGEEEEEEEETCGFCIFMKGGGCKDAFDVRIIIANCGAL